ncbi:MAG: hypothetical protein QNL24_15935 [Akkermansiaceae bacterium]
MIAATLLIQAGFAVDLLRPPGVPELQCCDSPRSTGKETGNPIANPTTTGEGKKEAPGVIEQKAPLNKGLKILILGDSMSLAGFGAHLDSRLRKLPEVASVNTYMVCGANPLSWLKRKPYTYTKTRCGYWSIENRSGGKSPSVIKDVYGMRRGHKPSSHRVPKLEDLVARHRPDILIFQSGNNMFGCFKDKRTIKKKTHATAIRWYVKPFVDEVSKPSTSIKKFYWVTPPEAGCVTKNIQKFLFEQLEEHAKPVATMIDSRKLTSYPYRMMGPDKEHFWGPEANNWADSVYDLITADFKSQSLNRLPNIGLKSKAPAAVAPEPKPEIPKPEIPQPKPEKSDALKVLARLTKITPVPATETFAPYQELLVGYRYEIEKVLNGKPEDQAVLIMHPAYIKLEPQNLKKYEIGKSYEFELKMMDDRSLWGGIRTRDDTDSFELMPYLITSDEGRHPDAVRDSPKPEAKTVPEEKPLVIIPEVPEKQELPVIDSDLKILFLGESMSLRGIGPRLDAHLRMLPEVSVVNTYLASDTNPLSWLKKEPYLTTKTRGGYWSIESEVGSDLPKVTKDIQEPENRYGPSAHRVPKLEELMATHRPDILIYQGGSSLFNSFKDKKTIKEEAHARTISWYIDPFIQEASKGGTSLKKFYFITPPEVGSVTPEIQSFLFKKLSEQAGPVAKMIDSRELTSSPHQQISPDKGSFSGTAINQWTDQVLEIIRADLRANSLEDLNTLDKIQESPQGE